MSNCPHSARDHQGAHLGDTSGAPRRARVSRTALGVLGALGLVALGAAPAAVADAPGLVVGKIAPIEGVKPGGTFAVPVTVANTGGAAVDKVWVSYSVTRGLDYRDLPSNCQARQVPSYDEMPDESKAVCEFDQAVKPGVAYAPAKLLTVKVLDRALKDDLRVTVSDTDPGLDDDAGTKPVRGTAPAVRLTERPKGSVGTDDAVDATVTTANTADFKVMGAQLKGDVGDTVPMKVTFKNAGPAWVQHKEEKPIVNVLVEPPAGTSVVKADGYCDPKDDAYVCGTSQRWENEDGGETYEFTLKLDKSVAGAKGSVALDSEDRPFDPDKSDDKADITLNTTDSGAGASTGGTDSGSGGAAQDGSELADTGSPSVTLPLAATGALVLAAGAGAVLTARRKGFARG